MSARRPALLLSLALTACTANWQPLAIPTPKPLPDRTVVEFHVGEKVVTLHGVLFTQDSVSGIPWLDHLSCDTCRVSYALKEISQVRTGDPGRTAWPVFAPFLAVMTFAAVLLYSLRNYHGD